MSWEYQVWQVQNARVVWVNGQWNGSEDLNLANPEASLQSCLFVWEALQEAGQAGWELVSTLSLEAGHNGILYLKRVRNSR
jgi:hypothetical protein